MMLLERDDSERTTAMECEECGSEEVANVVVEFTDGAEREIPLCDDCRDDYRDGNLVEEVEND